MSIHDHEEQRVTSMQEYVYSSIEELSDELFSSAILLYEHAYSKDSMTNGFLPMLYLVNSMYEFTIKERNFNKENFTIYDFLDYLKDSFKNIKELEKQETHE